MVSFVIFLMSVLVYLGLVFGYEPYLSNQIAARDQEISQRSSTVSKADQDKFIQIYSKIINIKSLIDSHLFSASALSLLESLAHPQVYFTALTMKTADRQIDLDGVAASFSALSEQLEAFAQSASIESYSLSQSQLSGDTVQFKVSLKLSGSALAITK